MTFIPQSREVHDLAQSLSVKVEPVAGYKAMQNCFNWCIHNIDSFFAQCEIFQYSTINVIFGIKEQLMKTLAFMTDVEQQMHVFVLVHSNLYALKATWFSQHNN